MYGTQTNILIFFVQQLRNNEAKQLRLKKFESEAYNNQHTKNEETDDTTTIVSWRFVMRLKQASCGSELFDHPPYQPNMVPTNFFVNWPLNCYAEYMRIGMLTIYVETSLIYVVEQDATTSSRITLCIVITHVTNVNVIDKKLCILIQLYKILAS